MKKRKIKLFASLTSLVMVVAVMAVGIWAANTASFQITANASFTASAQVEATIEISATKTTADEAAVNTGIAVKEYITNNTVAATEYTGYTAYDGAIELTAVTPEFNVATNAAEVVYTIKIANTVATNSNFRNLEVTLPATLDTAAVANATTEVFVGDRDTAATPSDTLLIEGNDTLTIIIVWSVDDVNLNVASGVAFDITLGLTAVAAVATPET